MSLRNFLDKIKPNFEEGGKFHWLNSTFDAFETFLYVPNKTSRSGVHIHDARDSKRTMVIVILALIPALLMGMYNVGYQHYLAVNVQASFIETFLYGLLAILPQIVVSYVVGLGIEFAMAQVKKEEVAEGFLVSGMLIPMILPIDTPLWMIAVATAFAVIFAKEVFGGTGYNIFNVALIARAFLFFAYPSKMSGDKVWVRTGDTFGMGAGNVVDGFSGATPLGQLAVTDASRFGDFTFMSTTGNPLSMWDMFVGLIPGSVGEVSTLAILLGAILLIITGVGSWKTMLSVFLGGLFTVGLLNLVAQNAAMEMPPLYHFLLGGFAFGAVFMATDPVTSARTEKGKWIYGFLIGVVAILIRTFNPGYPEGMMLAILFMNAFAPLIDFYVVDANIKRRLKRAALKK
ncbi:MULTISPECIES: NADH:ubiquinone reductase (Na(+)-transporting) subunit B [Petrimonas]|jgi:Na+-transporting NADH:ubiquinone oxidoreductase subunit B|uniref:Na(+)-translocating NADH-quinone reductase subunit B n=1 Tax=Petrimonas mucosa TaxID=1642646 RepID=A0A1G4GAR5_9BACT|nr:MULTISPECIES: NADH:ubiquinone reductase (Na(+)-transporting) subunit B [Petrimonas]MDD3560850.1 NADH:ubiquinone reductase (Na(+)-transporting) subunit B [Petrimonas mucosa]SCM59585.1 Na(+)-translocating NADH-quinone reductase subunit B {ECO:0000255/HAMAP-Rule:MF_00426} [Petrimonas mucosa]SFU36933.1 Na+-transporting NADH:ubiquinone oxidoreductase subunit B [Porphyromonadaceae bacterium KHP3R9]HHT29358.1 NADH:ubiquinone reductase (Na(+)-transporting) subunit B [Petrimonas mucosa]